MYFQESITIENSLAYKSLVEAPQEMFNVPLVEKGDVEMIENGLASSMTLDRGMARHSMPIEHSQWPIKSATLSKFLKKSKDSESPLKNLREIGFPLGKPRLKNLPSIGSESVTSTTFLLDNDCENPCETPSYMKNAQGNFPLSIAPKPKDDENLLPLPPRDRSNLQLNVAQKRHVRKFPLIIPASGVQRTLDKINQTTPVEEKQEIFPVPPCPPTFTDYNDDADDDDVFEELKNEPSMSVDFGESVNHYGKLNCHEKNYTKLFIENNLPKSTLTDERTYENLDSFNKRISFVDETDTASLHFESILENNNNNDGNISDDMVDGFCVFENNGKTAPLKNEEIKKPERKSLKPDAIESKKLEFSQKYPKYKMPRNELTSNALFNKIKESVESASMFEECEVELTVNDATCDLKKSINHVSCEDLLNFSENKPKGRERGAESDEVRIMVKMLGANVSCFKVFAVTIFIY